MQARVGSYRLEKLHRGEASAIDWEKAELSSSFLPAEGSETEPLYETKLQTAWDQEYLYLRFICEDDRILATMENRDEPLYDEEVVEAFLATKSLSEYFEFNLSPKNVVFDSLIKHDGVNFQGNPSWDCRGLRSEVVQREPGGNNFGNWYGYLAIPFQSINVEPSPRLSFGANFYRIKRIPREEYLAWSPTNVEPANFHVPTRFGELILL